MNLIKTIHIRTERGKGEQTLPLITSGEHERASRVIVICGRNRSGKSHLLTQLDASLNDHNRLIEQNKAVGPRTPLVRQVCCELLNPLKPAAGVYYFRDPAFMINRAATIRYAQKVNVLPRPEKNISLALVRLLKAHFLASTSNLDSARWDSDTQYRIDKMKRYAGENTIFRLLADSESLRDFEKITQAKLYFRVLDSPTWTNQAELILRYSPRHHYPYSSWSHGQKVLFCFLCAIEYSNIQVLLLDELETHLHPQFMTFLFERIKQKVPQTVAATHHPHLIFSRLVDAIWYLEVTAEDYAAVDQESFAGSPAARNLPLAVTVVNASSELEKLTSSYKLFDEWDSNLLRVSQSTLRHATDAFVAALKPLAETPVRSKSSSHRRDLQTDVLANKVRAVLDRFPGEEHRFLDFGAGRGRLLQELSKEPSSFWQSIKWTLWEPATALRHELVKTFATTPNVTILDRAPRTRGRYQVIVAANVIHELSPRALAKMLAAIWLNVHSNGAVFFVEVYPLLEVERLAVPYEKNDIHDLLRELGWATEDESLNIRNSRVTAYWLRAEKRAVESYSVTEIRKKIEALWRRILIRRCAAYAARNLASTGAQTLDLVGDWSTIASISSYFAGQWQTTLESG